MTMANEEVSTIGVKLTLDASGFTGPLDAAQSRLNAFQRQNQRAATGVSAGRAGATGAKAGAGTTTAGGGSTAIAVEISPAQLNRALRAASATMPVVNVPVAIIKSSVATMRRQIISELGTIMVPVSAKVATGQAKAVMAGMLTDQVGTRSGAAHTVESVTRRNLPQ